MKLQKRVDREKKTDIYVLYIDHDEANKAFERMTPMEKAMVKDLQGSEKISLMLKVLTIWVERIEEGSYDVYTERQEP
jgi:hypothetical protein